MAADISPALTREIILWTQSDNGRSERSNKVAPKQLILTGCPGSGKSHIIQATIKDPSNRIDGTKVWRTAFHHESTFGDFVGSYKPEPWYIASNGGSDPAKLFDAAFDPMKMPNHLEQLFTHKSHNTLVSSTQLIPTTLYNYRAGPLVSAYVSAVRNPAEQHIVIIEEVNRANPAHVFGDLLQLLDRAEDGTSEYEITPAPDLDKYLIKELGSLYNDRMRLPSNLYIWATMNRADETVSHMDTAFLRRWTIKYLRSDGHSVNDDLKLAGRNLNWGRFRIRVNDILAKHSYIEADKYVGPYFLSAQEISDSDKVFSKLIMYLWHDVLTMDRENIFVAPTIDRLQAAWTSGEEIFRTPTES